MPVVRGLAISLFSGAGGLDLGVESAGFHVGAAVELDHNAADTMEKNLPGLVSPVIRQSILDVSTKEILRAAGLRCRDRPDLLVGGPPCTPFSKSGFWLEWKRAGLDPDASLLQAYTRVLAEAKPRAFILENVYALTYRNKASAPAFARLLGEIHDAGYRHTWKVLNAADYGVPQLRPRLFVIGVRRGEHLPELPRSTHGGRWERRRTGAEGGAPHVTAGQALAGVVALPEREEVIGGRWADLLPGVPEATTSTTRRSAVTPIPCSSGALASGPCSSSSTPIDCRRRSKPDQARTSAPSIGTIGDFGYRRSSDSSRFLRVPVRRASKLHTGPGRQLGAVQACESRGIRAPWAIDVRSRT